MTVTMTPQTFVAKWQQAELRERAAAQEHFLDLCHLLGHPTPAEVDPDGTWFTFEKGAAKALGGDGWADVWKRGCFGWEYKGKHGDLDKAYRQLLLYQGALENPPLLIVSDIDTIRIHTHFTNTVRVTYILTLEDLLDPAKLNILRQAFVDPDALRSPETTTQVTERAARRFADMAHLLRRYGHDPHQVAHFLIRLLFCLFAEDTGILPAGLFTRLVRSPRRNATAFSQQLQQLFRAMATGGFFGADTILHVDGGLFNDDAVLPMDSESLRILTEVSGQDWAAIEPVIFGTLFERGLDPDKRALLGAHFTGKEDILLVVEPVLMAPLRRRWAAVKAEAEALGAELAQLDVEVDVKRSGQDRINRRTRRTRLRTRLAELLLGFRQELATLQVLDAACGSGNFLYVALRLLLDLEKEVINLAASLGEPVSFPLVTPAQLHGIEVDPYAYELAQVTIWIGYIQWLRENGFGLPEEPILKPLDAIQQMDAILTYDEAGRPVEPAWPAADVIVGNPPFLGDKKMRGDLGDKYVDDLRALYADRVPGGADLVTYWFEKARAQIEAGKAQRVGLLATNSIRQRNNRVVLARIKLTGEIFMAWSDRPWVLNGAAVRVSLVGFDDGTERERTLDGKPVLVVNSDLTGAVDTTRAVPLPENRGLCFLGVMKSGPFDIDRVTAGRMLAAPLNVNGRPNSDVVRPRVNGYDLVRGRETGWIIDFAEMSEEAAAAYELPFQYVQEHVKPLRDNNRDALMRRNWWLHGRSRPALRQALSSLERCIVTPEVAKHRVFVWMDTKTVPDHTTHVIARADDYFFGVLQSHVHEVWSLIQGARMGAGNDPRYSSSRTFETFPCPWPPDREPAGDPHVATIAEAARELVEQRDRWLNPPDASEDELKRRTLTNLYNTRPAWLALAHRRLDEAVLAAYGWPQDITDEELLARLLALNGERARGSADGAV